MFVLVDGVKYKLISPQDEMWLEKRVEENYRHIFGEEVYYFPKKKIKSKAGIGTIPDAYVIIPGRPVRWCIVEVELASHSVYDHVFPQLTKFRKAIEDGESRKKIRDFFYDTIVADPVLEARFRKEIGTGEIHKKLSDMVDEKPMIVVVIERRTDKLEEALAHFGGEVKVVEFKTYRREGISDEINVYCFEPVVVDKIKVPASSAKAVGPKHGASAGKQGGGPGVLPEGLRIFSAYKGAEFRAEVIGDGKIRFNGQVYGSPSLAAVAAIQSTGSPRETENGWRWWKFRDPATGEEIAIHALRKK
ncbi:MAG: hypothetical protein IH624_02560 [Phycisphaerae bacterium]|nr:hypothetical protein [Phycisphaerae bacterium]